MGAVARRWTLRHESRPYGAQQARKLHNVGNHDEGTPSDYALHSLFSCLKNKESKGWVRLVPAAAVIPAALVVIFIIGPKASVASSKSLGKSYRLTVRILGRLLDLRLGEVGGTPWVGVKSCNPWGTTSGEGVRLERV